MNIDDLKTKFEMAKQDWMNENYCFSWKDIEKLFEYINQLERHHELSSPEPN